jgi:histidinol-phosphate phosphatase family protein
LVKIGPYPILEHQIRNLVRDGVTELTLIAGHLAEAIREFCGDGSRWGARIEYLIESEPRGTAGSFRDILPELEPEFLVVYGDLMLDFDFQRLIAFHRARADADATLVVHPNDHPEDSDLVEADEKTDRVTRILPKPHPEGMDFRNLVNAAIYLLTPRVAELIPADRPSDFGKDILPEAAHKQRLYAYHSTEYMKDAGTPDRLASVNRDLASGRIARLRAAMKRPAVFLDRDGVLVPEKGFYRELTEFKLLPGVAEAVRRLNKADHLCIVVTNQPWAAKGFCDLDWIERTNRRLETLLGAGGAWLDALFYCPHHPEKGFAGERPELKIVCDCRKPDDGLIQRALQRFSIDLECSYFVGDSWRDFAAARKAGVPSLGVGKAGLAVPESLRSTEALAPEALAQTQPGRRFCGLPEAVEFILGAAAERQKELRS